MFDVSQAAYKGRLSFLSTRDVVGVFEIMSGTIPKFSLLKLKLLRFKLPFYRVHELVCDRLVVARKRVRLHYREPFTSKYHAL